MEEFTLTQPGLIGREKELDCLRRALDTALDGRGSTFLVGGEAGIGKTRLVTESLKEAEERGARILKGWCLSESLEPLMPVKTALRDANLFHLVSSEPPPNVISAYLMNAAGTLVAKTERTESGLDPDIFTAMLKAVGDFVRDSLSMMGEDSGGGLNSLGYQRYKILIQTSKAASLAVVIEGSESEFLIDDMKRMLAEVGGRLENWDGNVSAVTDLETKVVWFVASGKYDGRFLVDDPKLKQENLFDNVLLGLQRASADSPLVIFLDDLQWADPTTLNLVHYLARNIGHHPILLLGTFRPEDIAQEVDGRPHVLVTAMQNMSRESLFDEIRLARFGPDDTKRLALSALGAHALEDAFFDRLFRETEGTPFYVLEVLKLLVEDGVLVKTEEWALKGDIGAVDIPSKVFDVIRRRLDRLITEQREILEFAAVIGEEFTTDILQKTTEMRRLTLLKNLSQIEKVHQLILYLEEKYRFSHAKVREVLYNGIGEELRREYHLIVADTLAEVRGDEAMSDLAYHYSEAKSTKAKDYLMKAGDLARERFANEEAVRFYTAALETAGREEVALLHVKLGDLHSLLGNLDSALSQYETAYGLETEDPKKVSLHIKRSMIFDKKADYVLVREECDRGLELIGDAETVEKSEIQTIIGGQYLRVGDFDRAVEYATRGLELSTKLGSEKDVARARQILGVVHIFKGDLDGALGHLKASLDTYRRMGKLTPLPTILSNIGLVYRDQGKFEQARKLFEQGLDLAERMGDKWSISSSLNNLGLIYRDTGEHDTALAIFERALKISRMMNDKYSIGLRLYNIGEVYMNNGRLDAALDCMTKGLELFKEVQNMRSMIESHINLAYCHHKRGDAEPAVKDASAAVEMSAEVGAKGTETMARLCLGTILLDQGDLDSAKGEFDRTETLLKDVDDRQQMAGLHFQRGRLYSKTGRPDEARVEFSTALEMFEEMGMKAWAGEVREALEGLG